MKENGFWKVCEALDCEQRMGLLRYLLEADGKEFPCVNELAERFKLTSSTMSIHLRKLAMAGLVVSKRAYRRAYYRAFASTAEGDQVLTALRGFFAANPNEARMRDLLDCVHVLSHARRNAIVRVLHEKPGLSLKELSTQADMPPQTADRLWGELNQAHIVDLNSKVVRPQNEPEATLLDLTLAGRNPTFRQK